MARYYGLLSTLASDLDHMLSELCTTPPPPYDRLSDNELHNRQATSPEINQDGYGVSHTGTIIETDNHRLDGTANVIKPWGEGPITTGGGLEYVHIPTDSKFTVDATNTRGYGTDVKAQGQYNFFKSNDGRTTADVTGEYSRHYGGAGGAGRPDYGAFINFNHRF